MYRLSQSTFTFVFACDGPTVLKITPGSARTPEGLERITIETAAAEFCSGQMSFLSPN